MGNLKLIDHELGNILKKKSLMKHLLSICLLFFLTIDLMSQTAIIEDKDGFTNVRKEASAQAEIIYQLAENEVFFYADESYGNSSDNENWVNVMIPRNKFSIITDIENSYYYGYIHRSRLKPLMELDNVSKLGGQLIFQVARVDTLDKKVDNLIDGYHPYGLEIDLYQSWEVTSLHLLWNGSIIPQPEVLFNDLYNITFHEGEYRSNSHRFRTYTKGQITFIAQDCADGAGYYQIVWVIENQRIKQRLVGNIF